MRDYQLSNARAEVLDRLVQDGIFPNPETAAGLSSVLNRYLNAQKQ